MKYLVSYASPEFEPYRERLNASALQFGIDRVISYKREDIIGTEFYHKNKTILEKERGAGYWAWKPYIISETLSKVEKNAIVVYSDADNLFFNPMEPLFRLCLEQEGMILFKTMPIAPLNKNWTKRDSFVLMGCDSVEYWNGDQLWAGCSIFQNNQRSRDFIKEWLDYCSNEHIVTDKENICRMENFPEFIEHRYDQSVFSLLAIKYKIEAFKDLYWQFLWPDRKMSMSQIN